MTNPLGLMAAAVAGKIAAVANDKPAHPYKSITHEERFVHFTGIKHHKWKGATMFARKERGIWEFALAFCVNQDQFCKRTGRQIARRRYFATQPCGRCQLGNTFTYEIARAAFINVLNDDAHAR